ncbi:unnamed protein product [Aureobasidium uvarum]|uniref:Uncharacterized protein n=1 Tax=Aureobasidium uvarum TaxID=2773716 RepID=A0A9N8KJ90_9PEZI|nr:unnamed protein product [Aureobasidium uvarum]
MAPRDQSPRASDHRRPYSDRRDHNPRDTRDQRPRRDRSKSRDRALTLLEAADAAATQTTEPPTATTDKLARALPTALRILVTTTLHASALLPVHRAAHLTLAITANPMSRPRKLLRG